MPMTGADLSRRFSHHPFEAQAAEHGQKVIEHLTKCTLELLDRMMDHVGNAETAKRVAFKLEEALLIATAEVRRTHGYDMLPPESR